MAIFPRRPRGPSGPPARRPKPKPKPKPFPQPKPGPVARVPGGTMPAPAPAPATTTTTTTDTTQATGLPPGAAGELAQDAGQLEQEAQAANAYQVQQPMVTTPSTTAPANAAQDKAADAADQRLQSFFSTGGGYAVHYHPMPTYAHEVAASSGAENNPT